MSGEALGLFGVDNAGVPNAFNGGMLAYIISQTKARCAQRTNPNAWYTALLDCAVEHLRLDDWKLPGSFPADIERVLIAACDDGLRTMECNGLCDLNDTQLVAEIAHLEFMVKRGWTDHRSTLMLALEEQADRQARQIAEHLIAA